MPILWPGELLAEGADNNEEDAHAEEEVQLLYLGISTIYQIFCQPNELFWEFWICHGGQVWKHGRARLVTRI